jgi:hypothetical protein
MPTKLLPGGTRRAVHIFTPILQERLTKGGNRPVVGVREVTDGYCKMCLYRSVLIFGPSFIQEIFNNPLPGTDGRGTVILFTDAPVRAIWDEGLEPCEVNTDGKSVKEVLGFVNTVYPPPE